MKVTVLGHTVFDTEAAFALSGQQWEVGLDDDDAAHLIEFAGRQCYESWSRPNPATATNEGYLANIIAQEHLSVLEHGSVTVHIQGVSRSLTHELVRHRHLSPSQQSQRYVPITIKPDGYVMPPLLEGDGYAKALLDDLWREAQRVYAALGTIAQTRARTRGFTGHTATKRAREAARAALPNMKPTALVLTGNHHAWRDFLQKRATLAADWEMAELAYAIFEKLSGCEPALYADASVSTENGVPYLVWAKTRVV